MALGDLIKLIEKLNKIFDELTLLQKQLSTFNDDLTKMNL